MSNHSDIYVDGLPPDYWMLFGVESPLVNGLALAESDTGDQHAGVQTLTCYVTATGIKKRLISHLQLFLIINGRF